MARDPSMIGWGAACLAGGGALVAFAAGVFPHAHPRPGEGPPWIGILAGLAFALAGLTLMVQGLGGASPVTGVLPPGSPLWMRAAQGALATAVAAVLAFIGSWIAFGAGERHFSFGGALVGPAGEGLGRTVFGIGAVIAWLIVAAIGWDAVRRLRGRPRI